MLCQKVGNFGCYRADACVPHAPTTLPSKYLSAIATMTGWHDDMGGHGRWEGAVERWSGGAVEDTGRIGKVWRVVAYHGMARWKVCRSAWEGITTPHHTTRRKQSRTHSTPRLQLPLTSRDAMAMKKCACELVCEGAWTGSWGALCRCHT